MSLKEYLPLLSKFMLGGAIDLTASSTRGLRVDGDVSKIFEGNMRGDAAVPYQIC